MIRHSIVDEYFEWLCGIICERRNSKLISFDRLLWHLHHVDFRWSHPMDQNREMDGVDLRWRFTLEKGYPDIPECLDGPCSVLEMMVALALRCEEYLMDNPAYGNRTGQWFWAMIVNLGLGSTTDAMYEKRYVDDVIETFLNREYEPDGRGGLFWIRDCECDMRNYEIWFQLNYYIKSII